MCAHYRAHEEFVKIERDARRPQLNDAGCADQVRLNRKRQHVFCFLRMLDRFDLFAELARMFPVKSLLYRRGQRCVL